MQRYEAMEQQKKYIWYASYGSNLWEERFLCYLLGGSPEGTERVYEGCLDKTLPLGSEKTIIKRQLYFARQSETWSQGGVAFIETSEDESKQTYGRMYLITEDQFRDLVEQEIDTDEALTIDFKSIEKKGSLVIKEDSWYGNILFLGLHDDFPIFTFTFQENSQPTTKPVPAYLKTIMNGLKESYLLTNEQIVAYLAHKPGVAGNYTKAELMEIAK